MDKFKLFISLTLTCIKVGAEGKAGIEKRRRHDNHMQGKDHPPRCGCRTQQKPKNIKKVKNKFQVRFRLTCSRSCNAQHFIPSHLTESPTENPAPPSARQDLETDVDSHFHFYHICQFTCLTTKIPLHLTAILDRFGTRFHTNFDTLSNPASSKHLVTSPMCVPFRIKPLGCSLLHVTCRFQGEQQLALFFFFKKMRRSAMRIWVSASVQKE